MDRAGQGLERAILNSPVVEGTHLVTGNDGLAEVEFENQSALRLTENSEVKFSQLLMNDAGIKTNRMIVEKGIVYLAPPRRRARMDTSSPSAIITLSWVAIASCV